MNQILDKQQLKTKLDTLAYLSSEQIESLTDVNIPFETQQIMEAVEAMSNTGIEDLELLLAKGESGFFRMMVGNMAAMIYGINTPEFNTFMQSIDALAKRKSNLLKTASAEKH